MHVTSRRAWLLGALAVAAAGALKLWFLSPPALAPYIALTPKTVDFAQAAGAAGAPGTIAPLRARFLGVTTLVFDDGQMTIMTDGFFSRPGLLATLFGRIAPDVERIADGLARANVGRLAAIMVTHSHYDHALDSAEVAKRTGALLVGSESTANIGRGGGLADDQIRTVAGGETLIFGRFVVKVFKSAHSPGGVFRGVIPEPQSPPARVSSYREGGSFSFLIEHDDRAILVHPSAGFIPGMFDDTEAEVVFLGIGGLGRRDDEYRERYWREVVAATGARRVVLVHWDDFWRPLSDPLQPLPRFADDFDEAMEFLIRRAEIADVELVLPEAFAAFDPFAGGQ